MLEKMFGKNSNMRILIVTQYFWPENFKINDLAQELRKRNNEVTVLTGLPNYPNGKFYKNYSFFKGPYKEFHEGIEIIRVPLTPRRNGKGINLFFNYLSFVLFASFYALFKLEKRFDKIFVFEISPVTIGIPAIIIKKKFKIPIFFWVLDLWPESVFAASGLKKHKSLVFILEKLVRSIYKNCNYILVSSKSFYKSIESRGVERKRIKYFPNWAEDVFLKSAVLDENLPELPTGFNILYAGNIGEAQDFENIIKVIRIAKRNKCTQNVNWLFIGDGRKRKWLERELEKNDLESCAFYLGKFQIEEVPYFFSRADALFVSLKAEKIFEFTVPAKIQTYMTARKPILAMISGEGKDVIESSKSGFVAYAGNPMELVKKLEKLVSLTDLERARYGENGYQFYLDNFNRTELVSKLIRLLKKNE